MSDHTIDVVSLSTSFTPDVITQVTSLSASGISKSSTIGVAQADSAISLSSGSGVETTPSGNSLVSSYTTASQQVTETAALVLTAAGKGAGIDDAVGSHEV